MKYHRVDELSTLLHTAWRAQPDLNLMQLIQQLAQQAAFHGRLDELTDDVLIYQLKMAQIAQDAEIPGLKKDYEADFKTALLRARGVIE